MHLIINAGVPILLSSGTKDSTVPYEENAAILKERYVKLYVLQARRKIYNPNAENQQWRVDDNVVPTDEELADTDNSIMWVDWIRVCRGLQGC